MTETEKKALALLNEFSDYEVPDLDEAQYSAAIQALCRAIEQHEAFRQEVSDAVEYFMDGPVGLGTARERLGRFIIAKPDPLVEALGDWWDTDGYASIETFRAAIEARGGRIVWEGE